MSFLIKRFANHNSEVVGYAKISNDSLTLLNKPKQVIALLNGHELLRIEKGTIEEKCAGFLIGDIINKISSFSDKNEKIKIYNDLFKKEEGKRILAGIKDRISTRIKVASKHKCDIDFFPRPKLSNKIDTSILATNMNVLSKKINNLSLILKNALRNASVVTGRKLINSMWGAGNTQKYLDSQHRIIEASVEKFDSMEYHRETIERASGRLLSRLKMVEASSKECETLQKVVIPNVIDSYENIKKCLGDSLVKISPLLDIDKIFKGNTNYPAKWFISEEILINLEEDYDHLLAFLIQIPKIETMSILPLDIFGSKLNK